MIVLARPIRGWQMARRYWWPHRLTLRLPDRPRVHAWFWWNFVANAGLAASWPQRSNERRKTPAARGITSSCNADDKALHGDAIFAGYVDPVVREHVPNAEVLFLHLGDWAGIAPADS